MKKYLTSFFIIAICWFYSPEVYSQYIGQFSNIERVKSPVSVKALSFNLRDVKLLESRFKDNMERDGKWLLSIDNNRLLHSWRVNAGIQSYSRPFGGWEGLDCELRGHTLGHVLSGLALMYASTGESSYRSKADSLVNALSEIQQVLNQEGYLSAFPQNLINRAINDEQVWAPWYTLHKILEGLIDMYQYAGNGKALEIAKKMADWAYYKVEVLSSKQLENMLKSEFGGISEAAYNLYALTGNANYKKLGELFYHHLILDPLRQKEDQLTTLHANTQIPKIIGEARGYELTGDQQKKAIADFFWETVVNHHTYVTGGNSDHEIFSEPDQISGHLSHSTTETCNTYNMLKLTRHLFCWTTDVKYADYYERALYNHILASQEQQTGMVTYYLSYLPGTFKTFSAKENSFWCCVGTGFENHAKYGEAIYYHDENGVFVNLFIPSELSWKEKEFSLIQETNFPEESVIHLTVKEAGKNAMPIYLRYPSWAISGATVRINGKKEVIKNKPGSYIVLKRRWNPGDKIEISYPMSLHLEATNDNPNMAAAVFGPIVLAGDMGTAGIEPPAPFANNSLDFKDIPIPENITDTLCIDGRNINEWLNLVDGESLVFKTSNVSKNEIKMIPYYQINNQRYVIYWNLK
ncbi:beta-L-arabinofuranosidase domain-containing protein [Sunxiuqinia sp. A32]|uniref:beta-L-arabinofuranosidase domain-containing protein n=1 Tax=Sunxiuqinia sp. A32 TaxID=3461496 RepID=UPI004046793F